MIFLKLRTVQQEDVSPTYAEAYGQWAVDTPVTKDEYERFVEELDKAKEVAEQIYLKSNGIAKLIQEEA